MENKHNLIDSKTMFNNIFTKVFTYDIKCNSLQNDFISDIIDTLENLSKYTVKSDKKRETIMIEAGSATRLKIDKFLKAFESQKKQYLFDYCFVEEYLNSSRLGAYSIRPVSTIGKRAKKLKLMISNIKVAQDA